MTSDPSKFLIFPILSFTFASERDKAPQQKKEKKRPISIQLRARGSRSSHSRSRCSRNGGGGQVGITLLSTSRFPPLVTAGYVRVTCRTMCHLSTGNNKKVTGRRVVLKVGRSSLRQRDTKRSSVIKLKAQRIAGRRRGRPRPNR